MSEITQITDYEARLVALLPGQFKTGVNWLKLFATISQTGSVMQDQEDLIYLLWQQRTSLSSAVGLQLDQWGAVVGLTRQGWTDAGYRARILVWLQVLRSKGTPDELIRIVSDLTGQPIGDIVFWETPPASYSIQFPGGVYATDPDLATDAARYAAKADPAGVGIGQVIALTIPPFLFNPTGANGFSVQGGTTYGKLCVDVSTVAGV